MYSVVLMTALTAGSASPDHWFRSSCRACSGYGGSSYSSCTGCSGCNVCSGGQGSYGYMNVSGNFCSGCWGGYSGYGCGGCYGGYSGYAYYGTGYYNPFGCYGCYGGYAGWSCYGTPLPHHGQIVDPGVPVGPKTPKTEEMPLPKKKVDDKSGARVDNRARVLVQLPTDAKLFIDGQLMSSTSERRTFQTPDLIPGQTYFYDLKAEVVRDGRTVVESQRVTLRPGQVVSAAFGAMDTPASSTARTER